jgi:hypothetical protein
MDETPTLHSSSMFCEHSTAIQWEALRTTAHQMARQTESPASQDQSSVPICSSTIFTHDICRSIVRQLLTLSLPKDMAKRHLGFGSIIPSRCLEQSLSTADNPTGNSIHQPRTTSSILTQPRHCFLSCAYTKFAPIVSQLAQTHFHKSPHPNKYKD